VTGTVVSADGQLAFTTAVSANDRITAQGTFTIRYGIRFLGKPHLSIIPGLVALEYGEFLTGEEAWEFLVRRSNLHPRAEVFGLRSDGRDDMALVRTLDLALAPAVFACLQPAEETTFVLAALICPDGQCADLPARLRDALPVFADSDAWQATRI